MTFEPAYACDWKGMCVWQSTSVCDWNWRWRLWNWRWLTDEWVNGCYFALKLLVLVVSADIIVGFAVIWLRVLSRAAFNHDWLDLKFWASAFWMSVFGLLRLRHGGGAFWILVVAGALFLEFRMRVGTLAAHGLSSGCVVSDTRGSQIELGMCFYNRDSQIWARDVEKLGTSMGDTNVIASWCATDWPRSSFSSALIDSIRNGAKSCFGFFWWQIFRWWIWCDGKALTECCLLGWCWLLVIRRAKKVHRQIYHHHEH